MMSWGYSIPGDSVRSRSAPPTLQERFDARLQDPIHRVEGDQTAEGRFIRERALELVTARHAFHLTAEDMWAAESLMSMSSSSPTTTASNSTGDDPQEGSSAAAGARVHPVVDDSMDVDERSPSPVARGFTAINARQKSKLKTLATTPVSESPDLAVSMQDAALQMAALSEMEYEKHLLERYIEYVEMKAAAYTQCLKEGGDIKKCERGFPDLYIASLVTVNKPLLFVCECGLLPGCEAVCTTKQGYAGTEFRRTCVSHFFGTNAKAWKQVPSRRRVTICRKHYQTGAYKSKSSKAQKGDGVEFAMIQLPLIRSQIGHIEAWRGDAAEFTIGNSTAMQLRVDHYNTLMSEDHTAEDAAAIIDGMRQTDLDFDGKRAAKAAQKKAKKATNKAKAAQTALTAEEELEEDLANTDDDAVVVAPVKTKRDHRKKAAKVEPKTKGKGKEKATDESDDDDETEDADDDDATGTAPSKYLKIEEKTPIAWLVAFLAHFGGDGKTPADARIALDFIESEIKKRNLTHMPAVVFWLTVEEDAYEAMAQNDRYKKQLTKELMKKKKAMLLAEEDEKKALPKGKGKEKALPKGKGKEKALPTKLEKGKGKGKEKIVEVAVEDSVEGSDEDSDEEELEVSTEEELEVSTEEEVEVSTEEESEDSVEDSMEEKPKDAVEEEPEDTTEEGVEDSDKEKVEEMDEEEVEEEVEEMDEEEVEVSTEEESEDSVEDSMEEKPKDAVEEEPEDTTEEDVEGSDEEDIEGSDNEDVEEMDEEEIEEMDEEEVEEMDEEEVEEMDEEMDEEEVEEMDEEEVEEPVEEEVETPVEQKRPTIRGLTFKRKFSEVESSDKETKKAKLE